MNSTTLAVRAAVLLASVACIVPPTEPGTANEELGADVTRPVRELRPAEEQALRDALQDERRALATYEAVLADFGPVRPFVNVVRAEARHARALVGLFEAHGLAVPPDDLDVTVPRFDSVRAACLAAVEAELENVALYDRLLESADHPDVLAVFRRLQAASLERHLPAFRRAAGGGGHGRGGA